MWEEGGLVPVRWKDICNMYGAFCWVTRNKITGVLTVRLREVGGDMVGWVVWSQSDGKTHVTYDAFCWG